jgi:hypothetical protein
MKILQNIFRKNVIRNFSWHFSKSNSNFSELPHSMIFDERFQDLSGRLSAELLLPFLFQFIKSFIVQWQRYSPLTQEDAGSNPIRNNIVLALEHLEIFQNTSRTINFGTFPPIYLEGIYTPRYISENQLTLMTVYSSQQGAGRCRKVRLSPKQVWSPWLWANLTARVAYWGRHQLIFFLVR